MRIYNFSAQEQAKLDEINNQFNTESLKLVKKPLTTVASPLWDYLLESEQYYIDGNFKTEGISHDMENMLALYILNDLIDKGHLTMVLRDILKLPKSNIKVDPFTSESILDGIIAEDGTIWAISKYCQLDPLWTVVLASYVWYKYIHPKGQHEFVTKPSTELVPFSPAKAKIAIIGDWGTGDWHDGDLLHKVDKCPAQLVIDGIASLDPQPDYIIHLGDVYYAGSPKEERNNLLGLLPDNLKGKLYTMNSNHEMYDGANGLFNTTIDNPKFSSQRGRSYFSIEIGDWVLVALDSAYYDDSDLYMDGSLCNDKGGEKQIEFLQEMAALNKPLMLMTHHNGIGFRKGEKNKIFRNEKLWGQVSDALGNYMPDVWYWGHVHNAVVYKNDHDKLPILDGVTSKLGNAPKFRCCGHASMPFADAPGYYLTDANGNKTIRPEIDYYANTPMDAKHPTATQKIRVLNGFAVIDIDGSDFNETFYEVSNNYTGAKAVWNS